LISMQMNALGRYVAFTFRQGRCRADSNCLRAPCAYCWCLLVR
jgi:hypothetical protein